VTELDQLINACLLPVVHCDEVPTWVPKALDDGLAGVVLLPDTGDEEADLRVTETARALRAHHKNILIAADEEGGDVTVLEHTTGSSYPGSLALGTADDPELTARVAGAIAADLLAAGFNLDLAPSLDVNSEAGNPVIGVRAFGADPERVARHGTAFIMALQAAGVASAAKHFPGHGATVTDSHRGLPVVECDLDTFERRELAPFAAAVAAGVRCLMTGHVLFPQLDQDHPATLSRLLLHDLLRGELGFEGVLLNTVLAMEAGRPAAETGALAVRALAAGSDLLLVPPGGGEDACAIVRAVINKAVEARELETARLEEAAARVRALALPAPAGAVGTADRAVGLEAARRAVRSTGPVALGGPATLIEFDAESRSVAAAAPRRLSSQLPDAAVARTVHVGPGGPSPEVVLAQAVGGPAVVAVIDAHRVPWQRAWLGAFLAARPDAVTVALGLPEDADQATGPAIRTYGSAPVNARVAAELLWPAVDWAAEPFPRDHATVRRSPSRRTTAQT